MNKLIRAKKRDFFIAQNMIFNLDISEHAKIVYLYLCRCADDESQAFPSYSTIAKRCSISRRTALRAVRELQDVGLLEVKNRQMLKNGKLLYTSNLYILYDSPNEEVSKDVVTHSHQGSDTQSPGVVTHSHQGSDTQSLIIIPNEEYPIIKNTQSVNHESAEVKPIEKENQSAIHMTDRQTDFLKMKDYFEDQISLSELRKHNEYSQELIDEIIINILEMYYNDYTKIKGEKKPQEIVRSALMKLTYWHILSVLNKYVNLRTKVTNPKGYIQTMLYNIAFENDLSITNETSTFSKNS